MQSPWWVGIVGSLGLALAVEANDVLLQFAYPRGVVVDSFLFTYHVSTDPGEVIRGFRVPWAHAPLCGPADASSPDETHCARPPACDPSPRRSAEVLGPGLYTFRVQAERAGATSEPSNPATCEAHADCRWECTRFETVNTALREPGGAVASPVAAPAPGPDVSQTVGREALEQQLTTLDALIPRSPTTPVIASAPV